MASSSPADIDFAEVHDAFTPFEIISTEDLGFFAPGEGGKAVEAGKTSLEGVLPINPSGGLKARGHPVGASGLAQIVECARILRGDSEVKLKREPHRALAQSTGGLGANNFVTIVERAGSSPIVQNTWAPQSGIEIPRHAMGKRIAAVAMGEEGVIETFTVLYVTPDGFLPPLALALIRDHKGTLMMAQGEDTGHLKIGREVYLREVAGLCYFTAKSQLEKVRAAIKRLFGNGRRRLKHNKTSKTKPESDG
jgi:acetyl-CoA C-acetyltransferase